MAPVFADSSTAMGIGIADHLEISSPAKPRLDQHDLTLDAEG